MGVSANFTYFTSASNNATLVYVHGVITEDLRLTPKGTWLKVESIELACKDKMYGKRDYKHVHSILKEGF